MQQYIAFAWDPRIDEEHAKASALITRLPSILPKFRCALSADGIRVFQAGENARSRHSYLLHGNRGVVIGTLFNNGPEIDSCSPVNDFPITDSRKIVETAGRHLVRRYWGRYVSFICAERNKTLYVLRDPTGGMPCQWVNVEGINVFCSNAIDCLTLGLINCSVNWDHIVRFLWFHRLVTAETGLAGVRQVLPGECITLRDRQTRSTFYWRPDRIHDENLMDDPEVAMHRLSACIQTCVSSWMSCFGSVLHRLSGGLDSAIVLTCLANHNNSLNVIAQNLYTQGAEGDERHFARAAARHACIKLFETKLIPSDQPFAKALETKPVATPTLTQLKIENTQGREALIRRHNVEAVFSGQGGDHLFQRTATRLIAAEYVFRCGLRRALFSIVADTARFTSKSVWSVMATVVFYGMFHRQYDVYATRFKPPPFLSAANRDSRMVRRIEHPWINFASHLPSAKILQISDIIDSQNFQNTNYPGVEVVHPLISQPIIELCLQIPSYVLAHGGVDRTLVRNAFSDRLPSEIIQRTSKGGTTRYAYNYIIQNLCNIREFLLDGELMRHGILDKAMTDACLTEKCLVRDATLLFPILNCLRAEAWLNSCTHTNRRATA